MAHLPTREDPVECLIVGGGPAGLSAAIYLGRLRRHCLVCDDRAGRSLWSQVNRNYLGFPDGIEATELRRLGRVHAARYGATFAESSVEGIERADGSLFCVRLGPRSAPEAGTDENVAMEAAAAAHHVSEMRLTAARELWASAVVLAMGVHDEFPEFPGRDECVGRTLFWCTICDGYEATGKHALVLGSDEEAVSTALQMRQFTDQITLVADAPRFDVPESRLDDLAAAGIATFPARVTDYRADDGCITAVQVDDAAGSTIPLDVAFTVNPRRPKSELARQLGVALSPGGYVEVDTEQKTNVPGVYAAGDVTRPHNHQVTSAVHEGAMAAAAVNYQLYAEVQRERG